MLIKINDDDDDGSVNKEQLLIITEVENEKKMRRYFGGFGEVALQDGLRFVGILGLPTWRVFFFLFFRI